MKELTRRQFIKLSGTVAAASLLAGCGIASKPSVSREDVFKFHPDAPSRIVHTHHTGVWTGTPTDSALKDSAEENNLLVPEALREMLDASITALTGLDKAHDAWAVLFSPEERIAIKVNAFRNGLIWTHAPLVTAVTDSLQDAGVPAEQIVIFDYYTVELETAGFAINEEGPGVRCYGSESNYTQEGTVKGMNVELSDILLECDALINMPVLKSHMLSGLSFAMKNHYGSISMPSFFHRDIGNAIAELNALTPIKDRTRLIIGDVLTACLRYRGAYPYWSSDWAGDSILMSFDPVAIDATALQMLNQLLTDEGGNPAAILATATPCLESAAALGLGTNDPANIDLQEINLV
ncbi:MAG: DUF362 domain-containing protein [Anaerolineae bacterium]|nr:DUF362 domain-containing protein [Anaerolineae bacterium]